MIKLPTWQLYVFKLNSWQNFGFASLSSVSSQTLTLCLSLPLLSLLSLFPIQSSPSPHPQFPKDLRPVSDFSSIPISQCGTSPDSLSSLRSPSLENLHCLGICHCINSGITPSDISILTNTFYILIQRTVGVVTLWAKPWRRISGENLSDGVMYIILHRKLPDLPIGFKT